jgi:transcriptional regulator with XRE-family HTH domain
LAQKLTQAELGIQAGITQQAISLLERGRSGASVETWKRLAAALDVAEALFTGDRNEQ